MIDFTPDPIALQFGPFTVFWYGIGYAVGLAAAYLIMSREARRRGHDAEVLANGLIVVAVAALIGGRAYHVIDQWQNLYASDPIKVFLPPYTGLGVYGGLITGTIAAFVYARWRRVSFWTWTDLVAPGLFTMQAIARWGNFFNQELYGPPTNLPWGIAIQCDHRIAQYACPAGSPATATLGEHFQPLFLYESMAGLLGLVVLLILARRYPTRLRTGQLLGFFFVWYGIVRFALETLRADNWTFFGIPTAQIFSSLFILAGLSIIVVRGRRGPTFAEVDAQARSAREPVAPAADALPTPALAESVEDTRVPEDRSAPSRRMRPRPNPTRVRPWATIRPIPSHHPPDVADDGERTRRQRPLSARLAPQALADARPGGVREGLTWLGRPPEAKASIFYRVVRLAARFLLFGLFRFRVATSGQELLPRGGYLLVGAAHRGWMDPFLVIHALPVEPRAWFLGSAPSTFTSPWRERLVHRLGGLLPVWRGGVGIDTHVKSAAAVVAGGAVFVQMPEGTVNGPVGRIGTFRTGWAVIALRTRAPIVPIALAGTEELYLGRRMASRILPPTTVEALLGTDAPLPPIEEGSREEFAVARRLTEALALRLGPVVEELHATTVDPVGHPRRLRRRLTWLLLRQGKLDRTG